MQHGGINEGMTDDEDEFHSFEQDVEWRKRRR
jgi:hypothetical protein